jgi:hypothetical protein
MPREKVNPKVHICVNVWLEMLDRLKASDDQELLLKAQAATDVPDLSEEGEARRAAIIELADEQPFVKDGEVEIDPDAALLESDENGCYVAAWVWCPLDGTPYDKQGNA